MALWCFVLILLCYRSINNTQAQVDEVVDIMKDNVNKVLERDQKLTDIENKSGMNIGLGVLKVHCEHHYCYYESPMFYLLFVCSFLFLVMEVLSIVFVKEEL